MIDFELVGYLASILVVVTFLMKTMIPLRMVAVGSNVAFLVYGIATELHLVALAHAVLLPVNVFRLLQVIRAVKRVSRTAPKEFALKELIPFMTAQRCRSAERLFTKGEHGEEMFYLAEGRIRLVELDVVVEAGELLGEISVFSSDSRRTATARCETDCLVYRMTGEKVRELYFQDPKFGFYIIQMIVDRLIDNTAQAPPSLAKPGPQPG